MENVVRNLVASQSAFSTRSVARWGAVAIAMVLGFVLPVELCWAQAPAPAAKAPASTAKKPAKKAEKKPDPSVAYFADTKIPRITIEIAPEELQKLRRADRAYVKCRVIEQDGDTYEDVGVHLKGAAGSYRGIDDRPALTLNFDKFKDGQKFHGLDKVHLNNSVQDGTYMHEILSRELFSKAGYPSARATHALVTFNKRDLGLYVVAEGFDRDWLKRNFANPDGHLYDGGFCQEIDARKKVLCSPDKEPTQAEIKLVLDAAREGDPVKRLERLEESLNVDKFLTFMALELMLCHWDGYVRNRNNYRLYWDPSDKKLVFLAAGMDQMFGDPNFDIYNGGALVANQLMGLPTVRARYVERVKELYENVWLKAEMEKRIDELAAKLKPVRNLDGPAADMKRRIADRTRSIARMLNMVPKPVKFNDKGELFLTDFFTQLDSGPCKHEEVTVDGKKCLRITCEGDGVASYRFKLFLDAGKYTFEARAKAIGVEPRPDPQHTGAGIRISGGTRTNKLVGNTEWTLLQHELEGSSEVTVVLELRATKGAVLYEIPSIKLVRQK